MRLVFNCAEKLDFYLSLLITLLQLVPESLVVCLSCTIHYSYLQQDHPQLARKLYRTFLRNHHFQVICYSCSDETMLEHSSVVNSPSHDIFSSSVSFGTFSKKIFSCIESDLIELICKE